MKGLKLVKRFVFAAAIIWPANAVLMPILSIMAVHHNSRLLRFAFAKICFSKVAYQSQSQNSQLELDLT